jgi:hypothetical protein
MAIDRSDELDYRPSYLAAACASAAILLLYILTLAPSTAMWDTSEYIAAAYTMGIPHPPGNPMFVLIGRVFSILPIAFTVAQRINILAALASAISAGAWFLVTERVLVSWLPSRKHRILGASLAVLIGGTAFTVWNQSVVNEKVYTVSLAGIAIASWLMIRWSDEPDGRRGDRLLVLVAYLLGLGYAVHMGGMLAAPAAGLAIFVRRPRTFLRWKMLLAMGAAAMLGITPFAIQPIRAPFNPPINEGDPTACRDGLKVSCTFSKGTYDAFMYNFNRGQYGKSPLVSFEGGTLAFGPRQAPFTAQVGMWWLYFRWQWLRDPNVEHPFAQALLAALFLLLGLLGGWVHFDRDRRSFWYFGSFVFTTTLLLIYYLNFKYGASQSPGLDVAREVRDRDYFYLWSFSAWGAWAALGLIFIWEALASFFGTADVKLGRSTVTLPTQRGWRMASPILLLAVVPLFGNWAWAPRSGETDTADFARDLLNSVEPYGILVTVGDNDTFPLWYAQEVEGVRRDVLVANTSLLNTDWYARQLIKRPVYEYDAEKGPAVYRNMNWPKPSGSPLRMTLAEADSVGAPNGYYVLQEPTQYKLLPGVLTVTLDPRYLDQGVLQRADVFVLRFIQDSYPGRPIYFARTSGSYPAQLGLGRNIITQGLADKLFIPPAATPGKDTVFFADEGWFDLGRTKALWADFKGPEAIIKKGHWIDRPSAGIPYLYVATGLGLSTVMAQQGDPGAAAVRARAMKVGETVRLDVNRLLPPEPPPEPPPELPAGVPLGDTTVKKALPTDTTQPGKKKGS